MEFKDCALCDERRHGTRTVPGEGNCRLAQICLLGRNPGENEDEYGRPFIGRAGRKLNEGLQYAGILRNTCWVTNVSKCYTPPNVVPSAKCLKMCRKTWLMDELAKIEQLRLIVTFGNQALQVFEPFARIGELHGYSFEVDRPWQPEKRITVFCSFHPSAALRMSDVNKMYVADMIKLKQLEKETFRDAQQ
ncbi:hypothetical protein LCGC14_1497160 [marine sediment metagenome]|uniref:Uracil-DNA glycosylase-like domain-containing protein n=1 Tax=marine sediment metagenome TaxID=412755 RepID=A0A0F9J550_9ZZZZ